MEETILNKAINASQKLSSDIDRGIYMKMSDTNQPPVSTGFRTRALSALLFGLGIGGGVKGLDAALTKIVPQYYKSKVTLPIMIASGLAGATTGYFMPDMYNSALKVKRGEMTPEEYKRISRNIGQSQSNMYNRTSDVSESIADTLSKQAGFGSLAGRIIGGLGKATWKVGKEIPAGIFHIPKKTDTLGTKAWSFATKGTALAGAGYGVSKGLNYVEAPRSKSDYNTFLRNNVLAGNVRPNELNPIEKQDLKQLGMR